VFCSSLSVQTYDHTGGSTPGPNAPIEWVRESVQALVGPDSLDDLTIMKKVLMGVPFYGYRFALDHTDRRPTPIVGHELIKALHADPEAEVKYHEQWQEHSITLKNGEGEREEIFYPTLLFLQQRLDLARSLGASVSIWEAGQGMDIFYDLL
jgi:spore germination protein YaaH